MENAHTPSGVRKQLKKNIFSDSKIKPIKIDSYHTAIQSQCQWFR